MRIIIKGASGTGKTVVAAAMARRLGVPVVDEWDGLSDLPESVVAVTNHSLIRRPSGAVLIIEVSASGGASLVPSDTDWAQLRQAAGEVV